MAGPFLFDRVKETTSVTSTGAATLLGAVTGYQSFAVVGDGNTCYYCIAHQTLTEWEVGIGTYTAAGTTLARTTVLASSNSGSAVNFSAGTKDVFITAPAYILPTLDGCSVYNNATIAVAASSLTLLTFNSERFDNGGLHSTSVNTGRITFVKAGVYHVGCLAQFAAEITGTIRNLRIRLNGTTLIALAQAQQDPSSSSVGGQAFAQAACSLHASRIYQFAANDYIEALAFQDSSNSVNISSNANYGPEFYAQLITQ